MRSILAGSRLDLFIHCFKYIELPIPFAPSPPHKGISTLSRLHDIDSRTSSKPDVECIHDVFGGFDEGVQVVEDGAVGIK